MTVMDLWSLGEELFPEKRFYKRETIIISLKTQ